MNPRIACRVILDEQPNRGSWNMAVDEVLLETAIHERQCSLRWYQWEQATVSLGYFQAPPERGESAEWASLPIVRRLTGGGAILHHHEWTYSCAIPAAHPLAAAPQDLYERVHKRIVAVLARHGIAAQLRGTASPQNDQLFLCFGRGDRRDIVFLGHKIVGSAQRRRRGAILQHGSLLLSRSLYAPQFPGVLDLASTSSVDFHTPDELAREVALLLGEDVFATPLTPEEHRAAKDFEEQRYRRLERSVKPARLS